MKGFLKFLVGGILGGVLGWGLGYLRIPMVEKDGSFWVGAGMGLAVLILSFPTFFLFGKRLPFTKWDTKRSGQEGQFLQRDGISAFWIYFPLVLALVTTVTSILLYHRVNTLEADNEYQILRLQAQAESLEGHRRSDLGSLLQELLEKVDEELELHDDRTLSDSTIDRIAALSFALKPYGYYAMDSIPHKRLSPERGFLLWNLAVLGIDSSSFRKIKQDSYFMEADLCGARLVGADLSGANLSGANLMDADLQNVDFRNANLRDANLWGANLNGANLSGAEVRRADMRWASLNGVTAENSKLDGVNLSNAQLRKADLQGSKFRWAQASSAILDSANLMGVDMQGTNLQKSNLTGAQMQESNIKWAALNDANLQGVDLSDARVEDFFTQHLQNWHFVGKTDIETGYLVLRDTSGRYDAGLMLNKIREK